MDAYASALRDLKRFNRMVADRPELSSRLIGGAYDFLQWQQAKLFAAFRERHRVKEPSAAAKPVIPPRLAYALQGLAACALTLWAACIRPRPEVLVFSVDKISAGKDHDFRLDGLYRWLSRDKIAFTEVFHTQGAATLAYARSRRRSAVYHEAFEFLSALWFSRCRCRTESRRLAAMLPCGEFEEGERPFVRSLVEKTLNAAASSPFRIRWYRRVLRRLRPRLILAIDDTRYYQELCAAARAEGVPCYAFQHGHFTKYHAGWLASGVGKGNDVRPDALFVWSPYWKKELLRLGTNFSEEELRIGGNPKGELPAVTPSKYEPPSGERVFNLLVPFETEAPFEEVAAILRKLSEGGRLKIFLKTRPDWDEREQLRRYGLEGLPSERAEAAADHAPLMGRIDAVAGVYSTFLYDMLPYRKPIVVLKTSMDFGEGLVINGLADAFDASGTEPVVRLIELCCVAAPKLETRLERYREGSGDLMATLEMLRAARPARD